MQKGTAEVANSAAAVDAAGFAQAQTQAQTPASVQAQTPTRAQDSEPVVPVRSAKDAINAMYASDPQNRLSNYLATSAKEIINANSKPGSSKSAANLHHKAANHQMETVRPSASGIFKNNKTQKVIIPSDTSAAMDPLARKTAPATPKRVVRTVGGTTPVVKTSLKLGPKKTPPTISSQSLQQKRPRSAGTMRPTKGSTALAEMLAMRRRTSQPQVTPAAAESIKIMQQAVRKTTGQTSNAATSKPRTSRGTMMDIVRPARRSASTASTAPTPPIHEQPAHRPLDSIKRRFRPAPKDYTVQPETQAASYTGYEIEAQPPQRPPVEIYGMMDEESKPTKRNPDGLGIVEDYKPQGGLAEQKVAEGSGKASPDNNKYALSGQSPFFLKSVNVEKRPLSDAPTKKRHQAEAGTLYEQPAKDPLGRKNVYNTPAEAKKPLPTKPTVIIPASRRSKAPLVVLLLLTVLLGAAVGGFVYLLFFKELS